MHNSKNLQSSILYTLKHMDQQLTMCIDNEPYCFGVHHVHQLHDLLLVMVILEIQEQSKNNQNQE